MKKLYTLLVSAKRSKPKILQLKSKQKTNQMKTKLSFIVATLVIATFVFQKANAQNWLLAGNNNANASSKLGTLNNFPLSLWANGQERMRIDVTGNIGIGTTNPWNGGTSAKIVQLSATNFPQYLLQATSAAPNNRVWRMIARNNNIFQIQTLSDAFGTEQTALQVNRSSNSISTVSFPNGSVGIGTTTPWSTAGVSAKIVQLSATNFPQYLLQTTSATTDNKVWRMIARNSNVFQIQTLSDAFGTEQTAVQVNRSGNSISTVSFPNGNVGIGLEPINTSGFNDAKLQVVSDGDDNLRLVAQDNTND